MAKIRKPRMSNEDLLFKIDAQISNGSKQFGKNFNRVERTRYRSKSVTSYYIPISIYNQVTGKRFNPKLKTGQMVRIREKSTRRYKRGEYTQDVGDTYSFASLGMGSGKVYPLEFEDKSLTLISKNNKLEMNGTYTPNLKYAENKVKEYERRGWKSIDWSHIFDKQTPEDKEAGKPRHMSKRYFRSYLNKVEPFKFFKSIKLSGDGILEQKKLINGYITEVYIHFQYPIWNVKRESRFEVQFETGAKVIFTDDFLDKVYDVDYDCDAAIYYCTHAKDCRMPVCDHKRAHELNHECIEGCNMHKSARCEVLYDYTNIGETTVGKGILED